MEDQEPLYTRISLEVAGGRKGAGGAASTHDAEALPGGGYDRYDPLLAVYGAQRTSSAISRRLQSAYGEPARLAGPVFDSILQHVDNPPSTPVAEHADAFVEWTTKHLLSPINLYTMYPGVTAKEIKALASAAGLSDAGVLNPFLVILPIKSALAFTEIKLLLRARGRGITRDLNKCRYSLTSRKSRYQVFSVP